MQDAWIFNNFREGHGAVVAGSHTGAWIQDVLVPAQFRDVLVSNVSVDGAATSIRVDAFDPAAAAQNAENYAAVYHEQIRFQDDVLKAVPASSIDHLKDSSFENVVFSDVVGGAKPWVISNSPGVTFLGTTTAP